MDYDGRFTGPEIDARLELAETAFQLPEAGIPKSDLSEGVQTSLDKAETAYQKPGGGIPAADLSNDVNENLAKASTAYQKPALGIPVEDLSETARTAIMLGMTAYHKPSGGIPIEDLDEPVQESLGKANTAEQVANRVNAWQETPDNNHYPSEKLVYNSLGKRGVISQTQTWSGSGSNPRTYTMSNQVFGLIPQVFIDQVVAAGATFNPNGYATGIGYFELNGLTDISYNEMLAIYNYSLDFLTIRISRDYSLYSGKGRLLRTLLPFPDNFNLTIGGISFSWAFFNTLLEVIPMNSFISTLSQAFRQSINIRDLGKMNIGGITTASQLANAFLQAYSLESVEIKGLKYSIDFAQSSALSLASVLYMIQNEAAASAITITLHPTAYARAIADTDIQTALAAHTNVSLASA